MPAVGVALALVHVGDRLVAEAVPPPCGDQRPLVGRLLVAQRVRLREDRAELLAEEALAREPREQRPEPAAKQPLGEGGAGGALDHRAVEEQRAAHVDLERSRRCRAPSARSRPRCPCRGRRGRRSSPARGGRRAPPRCRPARPASSRGRRGFSESPKPRQSKASTARSRSCSSSNRQSYELEGNPCSSSSSGPDPSRSKDVDPAARDLLRGSGARCHSATRGVRLIAAAPPAPASASWPCDGR